MTLDDRLEGVFDRGLVLGVETLSPMDRELFRIQDFIVEYEMNGLSGYFYNRLPDIGEIAAAVEAMRKHTPTLAALLNEALQLFAEYTNPDRPATWHEILRRYDPADQLGELQHRIEALDN